MYVIRKKQKQLFIRTVQNAVRSMRRDTVYLLTYFARQSMSSIHSFCIQYLALKVMKRYELICTKNTRSRACSCAVVATGRFRIKPVYIFTCKPWPRAIRATFPLSPKVRPVLRRVKEPRLLWMWMGRRWSVVYFLRCLQFHLYLSLGINIVNEREKLY